MVANPRKLLKVLKDELDTIDKRGVFIIKRPAYVKLSRYDAEQLVRILEALIPIASLTMEDM